MPRLALLEREARDENVPCVQATLVGANDALIFDGRSAALHWGVRIAPGD